MPTIAFFIIVAVIVAAIAGFVWLLKVNGDY